MTTLNAVKENFQIQLKTKNNKAIKLYITNEDTKETYVFFDKTNILDALAFLDFSNMPSSIKKEVDKHKKNNSVWNTVDEYTYYNAEKNQYSSYYTYTYYYRSEFKMSIPKYSHGLIISHYEDYFID